MVGHLVIHTIGAVGVIAAGPTTHLSTKFSQAIVHSCTSPHSQQMIADYYFILFFHSLDSPRCVIEGFWLLFLQFAPPLRDWFFRSF